VREPLSVEAAVLSRDMTVLKREAADSLAALGAAHALVASARLAQVQALRPLVVEGKAPGEALMALAAEYQGWQSDQVRIFDALALVMRTRVPDGLVLDHVDPGLQEQARSPAITSMPPRMRSRRAPTWLIRPIMRPPSRSRSSSSMASCRLSGSRLPKPSSMNRASRGTPPAWAWTVSATPSARAREAWKVSPPERLLTSRSSPV
jgi:hypothetical protein